MTEKLGKTLQMLLVLAMIVGSHYIAPVQEMIYPPYTYLGLPLIALGLALDVWASSIFRKRETSFRLHGETTSLVTSGPFRFSRNPIYLGMLIVLLGMAIFLGSLIAFLYPILFLALFNFVLLPQEERMMEETFGQEYLDYKKEVRRWL